MAKPFELIESGKENDSAAGKLSNHILDLYHRAEAMRHDMFSQFKHSQYITYTRQPLTFDVDARGNIAFRTVKSLPRMPAAQAHVNIIFSVLRKQESKLVQRDLDFEPDAYGMTPRAIQAMRQAKANIKYLMDRYRIQQKYVALANRLPHCGSIYWKLYTRPAGTANPTPSGRQVDMCLVWPWEVTLDPVNTSPFLEDHYEWIHSYVLTPDEAKHRFGVEKPPTEANWGGGNIDLASYDLLGANATSGTGTPCVIVHEHFDRRPETLKQYPFGRVTILMGREGGRYVRSGHSPFRFDVDHGESPLIKLNNIVVPGRSQGISTASILLMTQLGYNQIFSDLMKNLHIRNNVKLLAAAGAVTNPEQLKTVEPGVIEYQPGYGDVEPLKIPDPSPQSWTMLDLLKNNIRETVGVSEVNYGESVGRLDSRSGYDLLLSESDSITTMILRALKYPLQDLMWRLLRAYSQYASPDEMIEIVGEEGTPERVQVLSEEMMKTTRFRIRVTDSALTPRNEQDLRREAMQVSQLAGGPMGMAGAYLFLRMTNSPLVDKIAPEWAYGREAARRENRAIGQLDPGAVEALMATMKAGADEAPDPEAAQAALAEMMMYDLPHAPHELQIHDAHLYEHTLQANAPEFELWPEPLKQTLIWHAQAHQRFQAYGPQANDASQLAQTGAQSGMPSGENRVEMPADKGVAPAPVM
ncbi:MAG TPA: hypothetical protein VM238_18350 [Phycisphaerae bacterium]|nr:hypothetical protein [Phycisphaerae bacterium]